MILQNKRLFILLCVVVSLMLGTALILFILPTATIQRENTIPESPHLSSLPPQADSTSEYTATIADLPADITYTQTRNLQDTIAYPIDPNKKGVHYQAQYRDGSQEILQDGTVTFLVDVASVKKTFIIQDASQVRCAPQADQKEPDWLCKEVLMEGDGLE